MSKNFSKTERINSKISAIRKKTPDMIPMCIYTNHFILHNERMIIFEIISEGTSSSVTLFQSKRT